MTTHKKWFIVASGALLALGLAAHVTRADYESSDTRLPSPVYRQVGLPVIYNTAGGAYAIDSFFDVFADFVRVPMPPEGATEVHSFFDVFTELSLEPLGTVHCCRESPSKQTMSFTRLNGLPPGTPVIDTEMLQLDLAGGDLPPGVMIRESPTRPSLGQIRYQQTSTPGRYHIDSFFDVFTELSIDGGQTWNPGLSPLHLEGGVPEPSSLILAGLALVTGTSIASRRTRRDN